jgi:hypothetical protein
MDIIISFGKGQLPKGFPLPGTKAYRSAWPHDRSEWTMHNTGRQHRGRGECDVG